MIQDKNGVIAAAPSSVPDRHFRNAWMFDSAQTAISEDITAAKIIFKDNCTLDVTDKLKIVGSIIGKSRKIHDSDIYDAMLYINDNNEKITTSKLSMNLKVTTRTIYRRMTEELNKEKTILNKALNEKIQY